MSDTPDNIPWHPAFYAATELEFKDDIERLEIQSEYQLSKEPLRIDVLLLKDGDGFKTKNEIGHIMRKYNVIEYKSPSDSLTIDDFYKTIGYAFIYKGLGATVDEVPLEELTVSLFRESHPRELFKKLEKSGHGIENKYPGIYYVSGCEVPVQIVVTKELDKEHSSLRVLSDDVSKDDVVRFLNESRNAVTPGDRNNIDAVLQASVTANFDLYEEVRKEAIMCQALEDLMKDVIDERVSERVNEQVDVTTVEHIKSLMKSLKIGVEQAMDMLDIPMAKRSAIGKKII